MSGSTQVDISVVLPVYNVEQYLEDCLDSIKNQQGGHWQIIAVNDASTDASLEILQSYQQKANIDLKIISLTTNKGAGYARNLALKHIKGKYTMFVDSDDLLKPDAFSKLLHIAKGSLSDIMVFAYDLWYDTKTELSPMFHQDRVKWDQVIDKRTQADVTLKDAPRFLTTINFPWNKLYKSSFLMKKEIKFSETMVNNDIYAHWQSLILANQITLIDEVFYTHRNFQSGQQITNYFDERRFELFTALDEVDTFMHSNSLFMKNYYAYYLLFKLELLRWVLSRMPEDLMVVFLEKVKASTSQFSKKDFLLGAHQMPNVYTEMVKLKFSTHPDFS
jgi:glycosyltransferase involved in cell wall biosynthesis